MYLNNDLGGCTVRTSVPSNAKFTDTTYSTANSVTSGSTSLVTSGAVYTFTNEKKKEFKLL